MFGLNLQLKQIFLTVYSFAFAGLSLTAGRWYTFMYILDLFITRQPSMRLQKNFRSSVSGPQAKFPPICSKFGRNLFFRKEGVKISNINFLWTNAKPCLRKNQNFIWQNNKQSWTFWHQSCSIMKSVCDYQHHDISMIISSMTSEW